MLLRLIADWRARRDARAWGRHPALAAVLRQTRAALAGHWPAAEREAQVHACVAEVAAVLAEPMPIPAVRRALFALMPAAARVAVVALSRNELPFARFLSGELGHHVDQLSARDGELAVSSSGVAAAQRYATLRLRLANLDLARRALGDCDADPCRDWFAPAWASACIFREDVYRGELGLPGLLPPAQAMYCSGWHELAETGEQHLRALWEAGWQEVFGEPSPFCGWDGSAGADDVSAGAGAAGVPFQPLGQ